MAATHSGQKRMERHTCGQRFWFCFCFGSCVHDCLRFYFLNEFMFLLADGENRAWRDPDHVFCRTAKAKMPPARIAVRRDDDKIDIQVLGRFAYLVGCVPSADYRADSRESLGTCRTRERSQIFLRGG